MQTEYNELKWKLKIGFCSHECKNFVWTTVEGYSGPECFHRQFNCSK